MSPLETEIAAFEKVRAHLEAASMGKWVLIYGSTVIGTFDSFEEVAQQAVQEFGSGPYLIREIGASTFTLPSSVMCHLFGYFPLKNPK